MSQDSIPKLDIRAFDTDRAQFVRQFGEAYEEWGFAGIVGHDIDSNLIADAFEAAKQFFDLETANKEKYLATNDGRTRGYIPIGVERAKDSDHTDLKEFYHVGREIDGVSYLAPNIWPSETPRFRSVFESLFSALDHLALRILDVVALYLQLPEDYFRSKVDRGEALLRILHYPPIAETDGPNQRAAAHEDINLITLLVGSEQAGLEVLSKKNQWVPINMIEGTIICNVGDMLQRLTNGRLPSTTHRVVNPSGPSAAQSRYSMPFFMHPNPEVSLDCLEQCVDEQHPRKYPAITAEAFLNERLEQIGLKN